MTPSLGSSPGRAGKSQAGLERVKSAELETQDADFQTQSRNSRVLVRSPEGRCAVLGLTRSGRDASILGAPASGHP